MGPVFVAIHRFTLYRFGTLSFAMILGLSFVMGSPPPMGPLHGMRIAIDAGHGGEDRGVCHFPDELIEKEINLAMAFRLAAALVDVGAEVFLTRTDDTFIPLSERAERSNDFGAQLFISLHVNRIPGHPECFGAQTFYFPTSAEGERLATLIQAELLGIDPDNYRQAMPGNFAVLRQSKMPGALVEIAFMTNERDRQLLQEEQYREKVVGAIVGGIVRFVRGDGAKKPDSTLD